MQIHLRNTTEARRLPKSVQEYMVRRFELLPEYLEILRCYDGYIEAGGKAFIVDRRRARVGKTATS